MPAFLARAPRRLKVVAALAVFLALAAGAAAQTETGRITGVVTDATGGILPGVTVTAKAVGTGATRELTTDSAGQFVFANLPPGAYEISARSRASIPQKAKVIVSVGGAISVDLKLDIAGTTGNPQRGCRSSGDQRRQLRSRRRPSTDTQIRELPTVTRDPYDLVSVAGNVACDDPTAITSGLHRAAPASPSTASAPRARTSCSTARRNNDVFTAGSRPGHSRSMRCRSSRSSPTTSRPSTAAPAAASSTSPPSRAPTVSAAPATSSSATRSLPANSPTTTPTTSRKASSTAISSASASAGRSRGTRCTSSRSLEYIRVRSTDTLISWVPTPEFLAPSARRRERSSMPTAWVRRINGPILTRAT